MIQGNRMEYVLIIHSVDDYKTWKEGFDNAASLRKKAGEIEYKVLQYDNDLNRIVHFSKWHSHEKAKLFFESPIVIEIRRKLGVKTPEFIYLNETESGLL